MLIIWLFLKHVHTVNPFSSETNSNTSANKVDPDEMAHSLPFGFKFLAHLSQISCGAFF